MLKSWNLLAASFFMVYAAMGQATLKVTIQVPQGIKPTVQISASGFSKTISESTTLTLPVKGKFSLSDAPKRLTNPVTDEVYELQPVSVEVKKDSAYAVTARYLKRNGSGMMWVPAQEGKLYGISHTQLAQGAGNPEIVIETQPNLLLCATDTMGNLYYWTGEVLYRIPPKNIQSGKAKPDLQFELPEVTNSLFNSNQMTVDAQNVLWLSLNYDMQLLGYKASTLAASGTKKPDFVIKTQTNPFGFSFGAGNQLAFAGQGGYMTHQLPATPGKQADLPAQFEAIDIGSTWATAYDKEGNLWTANQNGGLQMWKKARIAKGKIVEEAPDLEIETAEYIPLGIQFDNSGNMWVLSNLEESNIELRMFRKQNFGKKNQEDLLIKLNGFCQNGKFGFNMMPVR